LQTRCFPPAAIELQSARREEKPSSFTEIPPLIFLEMHWKECSPSGQEMQAARVPARLDHALAVVAVSGTLSAHRRLCRRKPPPNQFRFSF
jgi:hypothetical protein